MTLVGAAQARGNGRDSDVQFLIGQFLNDHFEEGMLAGSAIGDLIGASIGIIEALVRSLSDATGETEEKIYDATRASIRAGVN